MENPRSRDTFNQAVVAVLCNWKALQIVVENEFGGNFTQEKVSWLQQVTAEYFWSNADLHPDEVEEFLATILNEEFDTIVEDGSLPEVSQQLCILFQQCCSGDLSASLEPLCASSTDSPVVQTRVRGNPETHCQTAPSEGQSSEEGWEVVTNRKRRKH